MNLTLLERLIDAVLYEGYMLYPYRPSAVKNRQRWHFGVVYPQAYSLAQGATRPEVDAWTLQTECLVQGSPHTTLNISVRCLHLLAQDVYAVAPDQSLDAAAWRQIETLAVDGQCFQTCQEAVARAVQMPALTLGTLMTRPQRLEFVWPAHQERASVWNTSGQVVGALRRQQRRVTGALEVTAAAVGEDVFTLMVRIINLTPWDQAGALLHTTAMLHSMVSTHTILQVHHGAFVSLLDPPAEYALLATACRNVGTWPVLVGERGERDCLLSSPIILYDYPQVAPESPGDLFDATEIDELLTLRIMTLTEAEKHAMHSADGRTRQLLERTTALPLDRLRQLHGAIRSFRPVQGES
jgi:hydrogenase maturation protease